ncbi:hypothetical protein B0H12DRAFT_718759 [Mycena haematopus]|nr:hypothetical protein B0H12DRAFT_718759 [Mycena haematopus]
MSCEIGLRRADTASDRSPGREQRARRSTSPSPLSLSGFCAYCFQVTFVDGFLNDCSRSFLITLILYFAQFGPRGPASWIPRTLECLYGPCTLHSPCYLLLFFLGSARMTACLTEHSLLSRQHGEGHIYLLSW